MNSAGEMAPREALDQTGLAARNAYIFTDDADAQLGRVGLGALFHDALASGADWIMER